MAHDISESNPFLTKLELETLLDQVKILNKEEYDLEAKDGFNSLYLFWCGKPKSAFSAKLLSNEERIKKLNKN